MASKSNKPKDKEKVINILRKIKDPELDIDIYTLGLIYKLEVKNKEVKIDMTFTSPMCPYGMQLVNEVKIHLKKQGFNEPKIQIVFDPLWEPSEELKEVLGIN